MISQGLTLWMKLEQMLPAGGGTESDIRILWWRLSELLMLQPSIGWWLLALRRFSIDLSINLRFPSFPCSITRCHMDWTWKCINRWVEKIFFLLCLKMLEVSSSDLQLTLDARFEYQRKIRQKNISRVLTNNLKQTHLWCKTCDIKIMFIVQLPVGDKNFSLSCHCSNCKKTP